MRLRRHRTPERDEILTVNIALAKKEVPRPAILRILLLEDRADFLGVLHDYLITSGHRVTAVTSGVEGIQAVMKTPFDLILCDMMMPNMNGAMFYQAVGRVRPAACHRFIFFTGHRNNEPLEEFFRRINATVLYKPFQLFALDRVIDKVVRKLI